MRLRPSWGAQSPETATAAAPNQRLFGSEIDCACAGERPYLVPPVLILLRSQEVEVRIVAQSGCHSCVNCRRNQ